MLAKPDCAGVAEAGVFKCLNQQGDPGWLVTCDHASNRFPLEFGDFGISDSDHNRHIAYDPGAREVAEALVEKLDARGIINGVSRLVIDPNRGELDPTLVIRIYDGTIIEENRKLDAAEIERRKKLYYRPYREALDQMVSDALMRESDPWLVGIHSFTPRYRQRRPRPWHVGVLWAEDDRLAAPLLAELRKDPALVVGENQPYRGGVEGDCMWAYALRRGIPGCLLEIRNDLIAEAVGQQAWAERLALALRKIRGLAAGKAGVRNAQVDCSHV